MAELDLVRLRELAAELSPLTSCYLRTLEVADELGAPSVAFPWALDGMATRSVRARILIDSTPLGELEHWKTSALRSDLLMLRDAIDDAMLTQMEPQAL